MDVIWSMGRGYYSYYNCWMGLYILIFQIFIIVLYGIFVRTGSTSSTSGSISDIQTPLYFTLAFTLLNMRFRMYEWSQLANYLFIMALSFQLNTLYMMFWDNAFNRTFAATTNISNYYLIINVECMLAILVTAFQFTGKLTIEQIFALSMVEIFAFALNFSICQFGIRSINGGGTMTIFLFGYVFAAPIKKFCCDQEIQNQAQQRQRYFTLTMKIIGLVLCIILWSNFAAKTALVDVYYLGFRYFTISDYNAYTDSGASLATDAFIHMFLGFSSAIGTTIGLRILGEKIVLEKFINTLVITGMFLSSSSLVIIDPFASLLMGMASPIIMYIFEKYLSFILIKGYSIDAIIMCVLGGTFDAIFTAGRNSRTPNLADNNYNSSSKQGGLQFASIIVTFCLSALLGLLATLILRCFNPRQSINKDNMIWFIDQQTLPIYRDDPIFKKITGENTDAVFKQENLLFNLKNSYITEKERQNVEQGKILKQQLDADSRVR